MAETQDALDTAQDCYTMAYFVLPRYVFDDTKARLLRACRAIQPDPGPSTSWPRA